MPAETATERLLCRAVGCTQKHDANTDANLAALEVEIRIGEQTPPEAFSHEAGE